MWQLYAQTALDLVRERQLEAQRFAAARGFEGTPDASRRSVARTALARVIAAFGRGAGAIADASCALATRIERPVPNP